MRGRAGKCTSSERIKFVIYPICSIIYKYQPGKHTLNRAGVGKNTGKFTVRNAADLKHDPRQFKAMIVQSFDVLVECCVVFLDNGMKSSIQEGQVQGDLLQEADLEGTLLRGGEEPGTWDVLPDCLSRLVFELKVGDLI